MTRPTVDRELLRVPPIAWPTVALAAAALALHAAALAAAAAGRVPLLAASALLTLSTFVLFTPMHDAAHCAVARRARALNELIGHLCAVPFCAPFATFRFVHLQVRRSRRRSRASLSCSLLV